MEPHRRDEQEEEILEGMIRGGTADVTHVFLNESGEGDDSLGRRDGCVEEEVCGCARKKFQTPLIMLNSMIP